jgi:hypothetical protein
VAATAAVEAVFARHAGAARCAFNQCLREVKDPAASSIVTYRAGLGKNHGGGTSGAPYSRRAAATASMMVRQLPAAPSSAASRPPGRSARRTAASTCSGRVIQCRAALEKTASTAGVTMKPCPSPTVNRSPGCCRRARSTIARVGVDAGHLGGGDPGGQRADAAAEVDDPLAGPRRQQLDQLSAVAGHEAEPGVVPLRVPSHPSTVPANPTMQEGCPSSGTA